MKTETIPITVNIIPEEERPSWDFEHGDIITSKKGSLLSENVCFLVYDGYNRTIGELVLGEHMYDTIELKVWTERGKGFFGRFRKKEYLQGRCFDKEYAEKNYIVMGHVDCPKEPSKDPRELKKQIPGIERYLI